MVKHKAAVLDATFAALADPTRRQLLRRLSQHSETRVTELAEPFAMSLPAISKHLGVLERAGLLRRQRQGREHLIRLHAAPLREALRWIEQYRAFWETSLDHLAAYLEPPATIKTTRRQKPK